MRCALFDCFAGASGDMILGALLDAGLAREPWEAQLAGLEVAGWTIATEQVVRGGLGATRVKVELAEGPQPARHLGDILALLEASRLPPTVRARAGQVFTRLAEAEARIHRTSPQDVHFHEVGAVDAIVDIVGTVLGLELLGVERVLVSPLPLGRGWVEAQHGRLPLPAPATLELLRGWPIAPWDGQEETVTPTGAALLTALGEPAAGWPAIAVEAVGYGAGSRPGGAVPNLLRLVLGRLTAGDGERERVVVLETNIDDMNPQLYPPLLEDLLALGALDAFLTPIVMKSGRPATQITVLCPPALEPACIDLLLLHTTTLGLRRQELERYRLERQEVQLDTPYGRLRGKAACRNGRILRVMPEYRDCRRLAREHGVSVLDVQRAALAAGEALKQSISPLPTREQPLDPLSAGGEG